VVIGQYARQCGVGEHGEIIFLRQRYDKITISIDELKGLTMTIDLQPSIFTEIADFIASQPTLETIIAYRISESQQERIDDLLERNREGMLSPDEHHEMESYLIISHVMSLAKAKARLKL